MSTQHLESTPRGRALTAYDVAEFVGENNRYELIDGVLSEMSSPSWQHQAAQAGLLQLMFAVQPPELRVWAAPYDILSRDTIVQPDILVVPRELPSTKYIEVTPVLAVEILSPSTRLRDLNTKFKLYEREGVPSYCVVDPLSLEMIAWELAEGEYVEVANLQPEDTWTATQPFEVTITPGRLLD